MKQDVNIDLSGLWEKIRDRLKEKGLDVDLFQGLDISCDEDSSETGTRVKVVYVSPDLKQSVDEMGQTQRDQVVMVRVDEATLESLDAWVATGAVKSRSEAAALFIREGLKVRADELAQLRDALREVQEAQERLQEKARKIFGTDADV